MTLTVEAPALSHADLREVVAVVQAGLKSRSCTPHVYDLLASWCDEVEEVLDDGGSASLPLAATLAEDPGASNTAARIYALEGALAVSRAEVDRLQHQSEKAEKTPAEPPRGTNRPLPPPKPLRPNREGMLRCARHDGGAGDWLAKESFALRADRPGHRKSWCRECTRAYAAGKYLSTATLLALHGEGVLVSSLPAGLALLSKPCPACRESWQASDVVVAGEVFVIHKECAR